MTATEFVGELGPMDVVLLALKAHQIAPIVNDMSVLLGPNTVIVTLQNGIPWWYFQNFVLGGHATNPCSQQDDLEFRQDRFGK